MKYFFFVAAIFLACNNPKDGEFKNVLPKDLVGKTIEYTYGESIYKVTIDTDSTMHWEAMTGDEKGTQEKETYFMESVGNNKIFIFNLQPHFFKNGVLYYNNISL